MRRSRKPIVIASRRSRLARTQAETIGRALQRLHPRVRVEYRWIESHADRVLDQPLASLGGKGLFTSAIEQALLTGEADLAVHSLKDLPSENTPGLTLAAIPTRADVRDCLIAPGQPVSFDELPEHSVLGTSSPRRAGQARRLRPDLQVQVLRGNVETRIRKVLEPEQDARHYDATLLAAAGLTRLGLSEHLATAIATDVMLPAACQGALGIQCRTDDHVTLTRCLPLNDPAAAAAVHAEREVVAELIADCHSPIAVLCEPVEPGQTSRRQHDAYWFRLRVRVLSRDGRECATSDVRGRPTDLPRLVAETVETLDRQQARRLLAEARGAQGE
ncbi:MAG: hydroxymethylbilane synthase [Phycisphaeraceae bacterium]